MITVEFKLENRDCHIEGCIFSSDCREDLQRKNAECYFIKEWMKLRREQEVKA
jgi:hypothetical protein